MKTAFITGCASGFGHRLARALLHQDYEVIASDINVDRLIERLIGYLLSPFVFCGLIEWICVLGSIIGGLIKGIGSLRHGWLIEGVGRSIVIVRGRLIEGVGSVVGRQRCRCCALSCARNVCPNATARLTLIQKQ